MHPIDIIFGLPVVLTLCVGAAILIDRVLDEFIICFGIVLILISFVWITARLSGEEIQNRHYQTTKQCLTIQRDKP